MLTIGVSDLGKKLNYEYIKQYIESEGYELLSKEYFNIHKKLKIKCKDGHIFEMSFNNFKKGQRCRECSSKNKYSYNQIKEIANKNGFELLNKEEPLNMKKQIKLRDENNKIKAMTLMTFESKFIKQDKKNINKNYNNKKYTQEYVEKMVKDKGYELLNEYKGNKFKLKIKCKNGHIHEIRFDSFKKGSGCKQCMIENMKNNIYKVKYNLNKNGFELLSEYKNSSEKVTLKCEKGHIFSATYDNVINNHSGCPICNESKGEKNIRKFLLDNNIKYHSQYRTEKCIFFRPLPFDFYLYEYNCFIEFDGIQHFKIIDHFGGYETFVDRKIRDTIKTNYCKENNIRLIRIPYWDIDNIESILKKELNII